MRWARRSARRPPSGRTRTCGRRRGWAEKSKVGTFVEVKNSEVGAGAKVPHLSYVGDATIGAKANIGAATIFVNYDGVNKHRTIIGEAAFIGCDTSLIAPVEVGAGAYVAAGSAITQDVPPGALGVTRAPQRNIEGWVAAQAGRYGVGGGRRARATRRARVRRAGPSAQAKVSHCTGGRRRWVGRRTRGILQPNSPRLHRRREPPTNGSRRAHGQHRRRKPQEPDALLRAGLSGVGQGDRRGARRRADARPTPTSSRTARSSSGSRTRCVARTPSWCSP